MSTNIMSEAVVVPESVLPTQSDAATKSTRRAKNDQEWDLLKEEIYRVYMTDDFTLRNTMRSIVERHGFKASERKWKEKLKEWNFDKNISSTDMTILVAKAEKRVREEGKETVFFHGPSQITRERIEQFKRRKVTRDVDAESPSAETPKNITYYTPSLDTSPDTPEPLLQHSASQSDPSYEPVERVSSPTLCPIIENEAGPPMHDGGIRSSMIIERISEDRVDPKAATPQSLSPYLRNCHHGHDSDVVGAVSQVQSAQYRGDGSPLSSPIVVDLEYGGKVQATYRGLSVKDGLLLNKELDNLSVNFSTDISMESPTMHPENEIIYTKRQVHQELVSGPNSISFTNLASPSKFKEPPEHNDNFDISPLIGNNEYHDHTLYVKSGDLLSSQEDKAPSKTVGHSPLLPKAIELSFEDNPNNEGLEEILQSHATADLGHLLIGDGIEETQGIDASNQYADFINYIGTFSMCERGFHVYIRSVTGISAVKAAVMKAIALLADGWSVESIFLNLADDVNPDSSEFWQNLWFCQDLWKLYTNHFCLESCKTLWFCQNLWKLCFSFEKLELLEEAAMALDLIECGYSKVFGSSCLETMRCIVYKARILSMRNEYEKAEAAYRHAIEVLRLLGEASYQLKCQLLLSHFFQSLNRNSEALFTLVDALKVHLSSPTKTKAPLKRRLEELLDTLRELHRKISIDQDTTKLMRSIDRLRGLLRQWSTKNKTPKYYQDVWREFVGLGSAYSELKEFEVAEQCFLYPQPCC